MPYLFLCFFLLSCTNIPIETLPFSLVDFLEECDENDPNCILSDFSDRVDALEVQSLSGNGGNARGVIGTAKDNIADVDVIRIIATPGDFLQVQVEPGSVFGADLRPFLTLVSREGEVLGLANGSATLSATASVVIPREGEVFAVIADARNEEGISPPVGGNALDYQLQCFSSSLQPIELGELTSELLAEGELLRAGELILFSFQVRAGSRIFLEVTPQLPVPKEGFRPFFMFYSPSFDLGAIGVSPENGEPASRSLAIFGERDQETVLLGVSDFLGAGGKNFRFSLRILQENP